MRSTATVRIDVIADTPEARDFLLASIVRNVNKPFLMAIVHDGKGGAVKARVERASLSRVRKAR